LRVDYAGDSRHAPASATLTHVGEPTSIVIAPSGGTRFSGQIQQFSASVTDQLGNPVAGGVVRWSLSPPSLGSIDVSGLFTAGTTPGSGTVMAMAGPISSVAPIHVIFTDRQVWFAPHDDIYRAWKNMTGSLDFMDLFKPDAPWRQAVSRIHGFKFYPEPI
jgi:hypothetical protein